MLALSAEWTFDVGDVQKDRFTTIAAKRNVITIKVHCLEIRGSCLRCLLRKPCGRA